jgi:tryptophanase
VLEIAAEVAEHAHELRGIEMTFCPRYLRHFTAKFRPAGTAEALV